MAKTDGGPAPQPLGDVFEDLKRDGLAWAAAERALLKARVNLGAKRAGLAAALAIGAVMAAIAGTITLANVLVQSLSLSLGPIAAGLIVGLALLLAGALLIAWVRSLLRPGDLTARALGTAKIIWNALDEPH